MWVILGLNNDFEQSIHLWAITKYDISGLILGLRPANERRRYKVTSFLIGWAQT